MMLTYRKNAALVYVISPSCFNELDFIPNLLKSETMTMIELQLHILDAYSAANNK